LEDDEGLRLGWEMLGKRLPVMLSTQSIKFKLQKHPKFSPGERAGWPSKNGDAPMFTAVWAVTRSKEVGRCWEKDCQ